MTVTFVFLVTNRVCEAGFKVKRDVGGLLRTRVPPKKQLKHKRGNLCSAVGGSVRFRLNLTLTSLKIVASLITRRVCSLPTCTFVTRSFAARTTLCARRRCVTKFVVAKTFTRKTVFFVESCGPRRGRSGMLTEVLSRGRTVVSRLD